MTITEPFVLKDDIVLVPCAAMDDDVRTRIAFDDGDFTLAHSHGRSPVQVIDGGTAALLELFRQPRTIADAVLENSLALGKIPHDRLEELLPHLGAFIDARVLVPAGSGEETEIRPRFDGGATVAGWTVIRCVNLVDDTEVYQVRGDDRLAALKIARVDTPTIQSLFDNEAAVLRHLDGSGLAPALFDAGMHDSRGYLVMEWMDGVDVGVAAAQRRHDRAALAGLCASIAAAYAALHARGVLHVDIHPRNALVGESIALVDFGGASLHGVALPAGRITMTYFLEPEHASAPSEAGEQYAVAALLYLLLTGSHYLDFRYEHDEMLRQIECDPPRPFAALGAAPWPEMEEILLRALEKDPSRRHESMAAMAARLAAVHDATACAALATPLSDEAAALLASTLQSFSPGGAMFASRYPTAPTASINNGCAGAAVGLLRIAEARGDAALLALASVWSSRAYALIGTDGAFYDDATSSRDEIGDVTPYHAEPGIHAAKAMLAAAAGDVDRQELAIASFLAASSKPCAQLDLTLGRSGSLLAASLLLAGMPDAAALRAFGTSTMNAIWDELDVRPPIAASPDACLGLAHGWAGYIFAAMRWCAVSGDPLPPRLAERLHEWAELKTPLGRGAFWRCYTGDDETWSPVAASWCNGSAGQLFLCTLAHRTFGDDEWLRLAEACAWTAWDQPRSLGHLCCGAAGRAYALLNFYRHTGAAEWLGRARQLANDAAAVAAKTAERENGLWKGRLGVAVLVADLASPESARMPFFE